MRWLYWRLKALEHRGWAVNTTAHGHLQRKIPLALARSVLDEKSTLHSILTGFTGIRKRIQEYIILIGLTTTQAKEQTMPHADESCHLILTPVIVLLI